MAGASDPIFSFEYWLVNHKATLRTWWAVSLMSIMLLGMVWVVGFMTFFLSQERQVNLRFQQSLSRLGGWSPATLGIPNAVQIGEANVVPGENGRYDVFVMITNPNSDWGVTDLVVQCVVDGTTLTMPTAFINPSETRPIVLSAQTTNGSATCTVADLTWHRTTAAVFVEPIFSTQKKDVTRTTATIGGKTVPVVRVDATVRNDSGNNFHTVNVALIVRAGEVVVAADVLPINRWVTRGTKTITNTWTLDQAAVTSVDIIPLVSRFDPDAVY